jgi:hypothetical protein
MKLSNRHSPSGPAVALQLPYLNTAPITTSTNYVALGAAAASATEPATQYQIPAKGRLDTLQITNTPAGADAVNATYQVRKNGANVGAALVIQNTAVGPVKVDLKAIGVVAGDLISISVTAPAFAGAAPVARVLLTWVPGSSV